MWSLTKTLTFVDANVNANAKASTIALVKVVQVSFVCVEVLQAQSTQWGHIERGQFT